MRDQVHDVKPSKQSESKFVIQSLVRMQGSRAMKIDIIKPEGCKPEDACVRHVLVGYDAFQVS